MDTQIATVAQPNGDPKKLRVLEDYISEADLAAEIGCTERTLRNMPDGPPYVVLNRKRIYPIPSAREWVKRRIKTPRGGR
jgi:hypothetical protein